MIDLATTALPYIAGFSVGVLAALAYVVHALRREVWAEGLPRPSVPKAVHALWLLIRPKGRGRPDRRQAWRD
jgi:hypothetical protein